MDFRLLLSTIRANVEGRRKKKKDRSLGGSGRKGNLSTINIQKLEGRRIQITRKGG